MALFRDLDLGEAFQQHIRRTIILTVAQAAACAVSPLQPATLWCSIAISLAFAAHGVRRVRQDAGSRRRRPVSLPHAHWSRRC